MADHFIKASFTITVTEAEAEVLRRIEDAIAIVQDKHLDTTEREAQFRTLGLAFAECFLPSDADIFAGFLAMFPDPDYPRLGFSLSIDAIDPPGDSGLRKFWIHGDQIDIEAVANLIQTVARSALPFGFEYAIDCSRMRLGEFGGGFVAIRADDIEFGNSAQGLERALTRLPDDARHGLVIAIRDEEEGLLFWNTDTGFGSLETATVYSEAEALRCDLPIANDQPEWLAMPAPLA